MRRGILPTDGDQMRLLNTLFADVAAYGADLEDYMVGNPEIADTMMRLLINCEAYEVLASLQAMQPKQP